MQKPQHDRSNEMTEPACHSRRQCDREKCEHVVIIESRLEDGDKRMDRIESNTKEVLAILEMGKTFFKLTGYIGAGVKWVVAIAAPIVAMYFAFKKDH